MNDSPWQWVPVTGPMLAIGLVCAWLSFVAWRRRFFPGARAFSVLMAALAGWTFLNIVEKSLVEHDARKLVSDLVYLFIVICPAAWLVFASRFARLEHWLPRTWLPLLGLVPAVSLALVFTDRYHGLFRAATAMRTVDGRAMMVVQYGPMFWVNTFYTYVLFLAGAVGVVVGTLRRPNWNWGQMTLLLLGMLAPTLGNAAYLWGFTSDLTCVYFAVSGIAAFWVLFHVRIFDILPVARDFVLEHMRDAVFVLDQQMRIVDLNQAALTILPAERTWTRRTPLVDLLPDLAPGLLNGGAGPGPQRIEARLSTEPEGRVHEMEVVPLNEGQTRIGYLVQLTDITERKRAETERREMETRLRQTQKLESLGVLAGGIAHDFNNLLAVILGNAEMAEQDLDERAPARLLVSNILAAAERATAVTGQMLAYSGKGSFIVEALLLSALVRDMADLLRAAVPRHAELELDLMDRLPLVIGDPGQLRQVVLNLVGNAADALGDEPGSIRVRTRVVDVRPGDLAKAAINAGLAPGQHVLLSVTDTGKGMDQTMVARAFEPFFTTKFTGRGLGLAVVLGIVRGHRGAIEVDSEPGVGTEFGIVLPRAETSPLVPRSPATVGFESIAVPRNAATDLSRRGLADPLTVTGTVLVVDDEDHVRAVAERILKLDGFTVMTARDGGQALDLFRRHRSEIEVVLLDLTMPVLRGDEVFRRLRLVEPNLPVIITSGFSEEETLRRFEGNEPSAFLGKPYQMKELRAKVRELMLRARARRP